MEEIWKYGEALEVKFMELEVMEGLECSNPKCSDKDHMMEIDNNVLDVLMGIVKASYCSIPIVKKDESQASKNNKVMPNWEKEVNPFRSATICWPSQWVNEGRCK